MLVILILSPGALAPPSSALSRRAVLAAAPLSLLAQPHAAVAGGLEAKQKALETARAREAKEAAYEAGLDADPLTRTLQVYRSQLADAEPLLENKKWDDVRKITQKLLTIMTLRGYTGESVKARADAWMEAGETKKANEIFERRQDLVVKTSTLELAIFAAQTNDKKKMVTPDELKLQLKGVVTSLDAVIAKMGCQKKEDGTERRWRSGACEILPLAPDLRDLMY